MPVYEYTCNACNAKVSIFVRSVNSPLNSVCDRCGSTDLRRLISKFAVMRPGSNDLDSFGDVDTADPHAMAEWARRMQADAGDDLGPEFNDMVDRLDSGESIDDDLGLSGHSHDDFGLG